MVVIDPDQVARIHSLANGLRFESIAWRRVAGARLAQYAFADSGPLYRLDQVGGQRLLTPDIQSSFESRNGRIGGHLVFPRTKGTSLLLMLAKGLGHCDVTAAIEEPKCDLSWI